MEAIVDPPRLLSLGPKPLRIVVHTTASATETLELAVVFPSETVYNIKQRITVLKGAVKDWMPSHQFVAVEEGTGYRPGDVKWATALATVPNPLAPAVKGRPNPHLFADGERVATNPVRMPSLLLDDVFREGEPRVLHVWTVKTIWDAVGEALTPEVFVGFYQLYFPNFRSREDLEEAVGPATAADTQALAALQAFVTSQQANLALLENLLPDALGSTPLHELRQLVFELPVPKGTSLELLFYNTEASPALPFLRYFPVQARVAPLIKYSASTIKDTRVFESLMAEQPGAAEAMLLLKCPVKHVRAPFGTAWTMRVTATRVEVSIGAPRRDTPLKGDVVRHAYAELGPFLTATPFGAASLALTNLTAVYALKSPLPDKLVKRDLVQRLTPFLSLFHNDAMLHGDKATLSLRYKAVSNYVKETDPKLAYLTTLFLRDATVSEGTIPVASYISSLASEFGIGTREAADLVSAWLAQEAKGVSDIKEGSDAEKERFIKLHPMGVHVSLYNNHPSYLAAIAGCERLVDLQRILSLLSALVSLPMARFRAAAASLADRVGVAAAETVAAASVPVAEVAAEEAASLSAAAAPEGAPAVWDMMNFGGEEVGGEEAETLENAVAVNAEPATATTAETAAATATVEPVISVSPDGLTLPTRLAEGETIHPIVDKWYLDQFRRVDPALIDYTNESGDARVQLYSSRCQFNVHKQPNLLTYADYMRVKTLYGDSVFWLETPLQGRLAAAIKLAAVTPKERIKKLAEVDATAAASVDKIGKLVALEQLALSKGLELRNGSITELKEYAKSIKAEDKARIAAQIATLATKDVWVVARAGTGVANYYLCAEFWCVRDGYPLLPLQYRGTTWYDGTPGKPKDRCPFCGGSPIKDRKHPGAHETVLVRPEQGDTHKVAKYAGFLGELYHPLKYALPCCFTTLRNITPPEDSKMPAAAEPEEEGEEASAPASAALSDEDRSNRDRPFSPKTLGSKKANRWCVSLKNVVGRAADRPWIDLERGGIAVPPASVNALLGQNPDTFLTRNKGVTGEKINSSFAPNSSAFVRYGLDHNGANPGLQFHSLLSYIRYACKFSMDPDGKNAIESSAVLFKALFEGESAKYMVRGLEQANNGTLLHEMSVPGDRSVSSAELMAFCRDMDIEYCSAKTKAESTVLYHAFDNFRRYTESTVVVKDLRLWDSLLACPGLLTVTGVLLVLIRVPVAGSKEKASFQCPGMGIARCYQREPPPFLFLMVDDATGQMDPLVFYESKMTAKDEKPVVTLFGVVDGRSRAFGDLSPPLRAVMTDFMTEYAKSTTGCGRSVPPVHPWIPVAGREAPPASSELEALCVDGIVAKALLRDRSNRLVGALVVHEGREFVLPLVDDGALHLFTPSLRGEQHLPTPDLGSLFTFYGTVMTKHRALLPIALIPNEDDTTFIAVRLACGLLIPCAPSPRGRTIANELYTSLQASFRSGVYKMPWALDAELLKPEGVEGGIGATSEEVLAESYEQLRLSVSHWLQKDAQSQLVTQIERLREARTVLPLWELQKRLEYLLMPEVMRMVTTEGAPRFKHRDVLRRDCLIQSEAECGGGCVWLASAASAASAAAGGQCLIHTTATPRYKDPVRLLTVRLVNELLETFDLARELLDDRVSAIKPLKAGEIVRGAGENSVLFSAPGGSSAELLTRLGYDQRKPTAFTRGLTYPEEVSREPEVAADYGTIVPTVARAGLAPSVAAMAQLAAYTGKTPAGLEAELGRPFTFSVTDWQYVADVKHVGIVLHFVDPSHQSVVVDSILRPSEGAKDLSYLLVNYDNRLMSDRDGTVEFVESRLPASVRLQLS
jgi:hypothetical protein